MDRKLIIGTLAGSALVLGACATEQRAQAPQTSGTEFTRELARQYYGYSEQQRREAYDFGAANYFGRKGDRAAKGETIAPETPGQGWRPRNQAVGSEVTAARQRLDTALQSNAPQRAPVPLARAQVRYDCWLEHTDDPTLAVQGAWLNQKLQECRSEFEAAMAEVDTAMRPVAAAPTPAPAAQPPREQSFLVFFDFDRAEVTSQGQQVIQRALQTLRSGGTARIVATGHADRAGTDQYNQALSARRAEAVRQALANNGLPPTQVETNARGETQPLVPTADGEREPQNRRVEIVIQ
jgi:OOP family OmpA-OmpF porin